MGVTHTQRDGEVAGARPLYEAAASHDRLQRGPLLVRQRALSGAVPDPGARGGNGAAAG